MRSPGNTLHRELLRLTIHVPWFLLFLFLFSPLVTALLADTILHMSLDTCLRAASHTFLQACLHGAPQVAVDQYGQTCRMIGCRGVIQCVLFELFPFLPQVSAAQDT